MSEPLALSLAGMVLFGVLAAIYVLRYRPSTWREWARYVLGAIAVSLVFSTVLGELTLP